MREICSSFDVVVFLSIKSYQTLVKFNDRTTPVDRVVVI